MEENPLADFLGKYIGAWCEPIIEAMPPLDKALVFNLMDNWWKEQYYMEKHMNEPELIYGCVDQQDEYISEIRKIVNKNVKAQRTAAKASNQAFQPKGF